MKDVTDNINKIEIKNDILPMANNDDNKFEIIYVDNKYHIKDYEETKNKLTKFLEIVDSYEYSDSDRAEIKKLKSESNKLSKGFKTSIASAKSEMFSDIEKESSDIILIINKIHDKLNIGLTNDDKKVKAKNKKEIKENFDEAILTYNLSDKNIDFEDIYEVSWFNRSASRKKVIVELDKRLNTLMSLFNNSSISNLKTKEIIEQLIINDWDGLKTQNDLIVIIKERQARAIEEQIKLQAQQELERKISSENSLKSENYKQEEQDEDKQEEQLYKLIKIKAEDISRVSHLLSIAKIEYSEVL